MSDSWLQVRVHVPSSQVDAVSDVLLRLGATGLQEDHPGLHFEDGDGPLVPEGWDLAEAHNPTGYVDLSAWFPGSEDVEALRAWVLDETGLEASIRRVDNEDWNETWKRSWKPGPLCRRVLIVPSWEVIPPVDAGQRVLRMDPGVAFGTGTHPTTRACAAFVDELVAQGGVRSVLDVGTGTGVLAIAALMLGAERAVGVDTDALAVQAATGNADANGVGARFEGRVGSLDSVDGTWDLVLANLLAPLLIELAADLAKHTAPGGSLVASGILVEQTAEVVDALVGAGFSLAERVDGPAWSALRLEIER